MRRSVVAVISVLFILTGCLVANDIVVDDFDLTLWHVPEAANAVVYEGLLLLPGGNVDHGGVSLSSITPFSYSNKYRHTIFLRDPDFTKDPGIALECWISGNAVSPSTWWNDPGPGLFIGLYPITEDGILKELNVNLNVKTSMAGKGGGVTWASGGLGSWPRAVELTIENSEILVRFIGATFYPHSSSDNVTFVGQSIKCSYSFDFEQYYYHFGVLNRGAGRGVLAVAGVAVEELD